MSKGIDNVVSAFSIKGSAVARRVLSVGLAQIEDAENKKTAAQVHAEVTSAAEARGIILDRFSGSTVANAATSFGLYVSTGLPVPTSANTNDGTALGVCGLIESARVKHGKKAVADTIKVALSTVTEYATASERAETVADHLSALIELDPAPKESKTQTPAQRLLSALRAADTLALEAELSDEEVTEAQRLIESIRTTAESWA